MSRVVRDSIIYSASGIAMRFLSFASALFLRRLIPPAQFGLWSLTQVIVNFVSNFDPGVGVAISRDVPLERGRENDVAVRSLQATGLLLAIGQGLLYTLAVLMYWWLVGGRGDSSSSFVYLAAATMLLLLPVTAVGQALIMAHSRFDQAGYLGILVNLLQLLCSLIGGLLAGAPGLIIAGMITTAASACLTWYYLRNLGIRLEIHRVSSAVIKRLLGYGLPMRLWDYPTSIFQTIDTLVVATLLGTQNLAVYATAGLVVAVVSDFASRLGAAKRNEWLMRFGRNPNSGAIAEGAYRLLNLLVLLVWPPLALLSYAVMQLVGLALIPQYMGALPVLKLLLVAWVFLPQAYGIRDLWVVQANFRGLFLSGTWGLFAFGIVVGAARYLSMNIGIETIALCYVVSSMLYMGVLLATAGNAMWGERRTLLAAAALLISGGMTWVSMTLATLPVDWGLSDYNMLVWTLARSALFLAPLVLVGLMISWRMFGMYWIGGLNGLAQWLYSIRKPNP